MYGYNSNYYNNNLMKSIAEATSKVFVGEEERKRKYLGSKTYYMDQIDQLSPERQELLKKAQAAGDVAERDPSGELKVAGMIAGVPRTGPGGDLYGVDRFGKALVTVSQYEDLPEPPKQVQAASLIAPATSPVTPKSSKLPDTTGFKNPHTQDFGISEIERQRRLQNAEDVAKKRAQNQGRYQFDVPLELSTADIRKPEVGAFAAPGASNPVQSVKSADIGANTPLQQQIQNLEAIRRRQLANKNKPQVKPISIKPGIGGREF